MNWKGLSPESKIAITNNIFTWTRGFADCLPSEAKENIVAMHGLTAREVDRIEIKLSKLFMQE